MDYGMLAAIDSGKDQKIHKDKKGKRYGKD